MERLLMRQVDKVLVYVRENAERRKCELSTVNKFNENILV